ncbi:hypothetical protein [Robertkochia solimangrovi]|uniref:hypothetical protein n=1 Tax=Robertkochia solimangrovi TaxID=2213046 RepID=UPI00117CC211|nr:hypothetical protein [Robertkochia solimangrovi]TRZ41946.1 hypothetical protein DMZ48_15010 [Robertkochia solimangrovi]
MPANPKYLSSPLQRFAKISAGFLGGYLVTMSIHLALASWFDTANIVITSAYSGFILWAVLFVLAFLGKNGWKVWLLYLAITLLFGLICYFGIQNQSIV